MKYFEKKVSTLLLAFAMMLTMVFGAAVSVNAEALDDTTEQMIVESAQSLVDSIIVMSDEEIETYLASGDDFTVTAMNAWKSNKGDLGAKAEDQSEAGEPVITGSDNTYTVTIPVLFEKTSATFAVSVDITSGWTGFTVDVKTSLADNLKTAGLNTLMGLGTVFIVLVFLAFLISMFKYIGTPGKKEQEKAAAVAAAPAPQAVVEEEEVDDLELIAVITAAIAATEGTGTDGFVVRSIRKARRSR